MRVSASLLLLICAGVSLGGTSSEGDDRASFALNDFTRLGQTFTTDTPFDILVVSAPSWSDSEGGFTLSVYDSPRREKLLARQAYSDFVDNAELTLYVMPAAPAGTYYWEISDRTGRTNVGLYAFRNSTYAGGCAYFDGVADEKVDFVSSWRYTPYVGTLRRFSLTEKRREASAAEKNLPQWIWYPEPRIPDNCTRYFRFTFDLPAGVRSADLLITGDDGYEVWANGKDLGGGGWDHPKHFDVAATLHQGRNLIAARVGNAVAPAGLIVLLKGTLGDGRPLRLTSDTSDHWRSFDNEVPHWASPDFDDSAWKPCVSTGDALSDPWFPHGTVSEFAADCFSQKAILDKLRGEVPVAKRSEFVGRRRQAQAVLKAFHDGAAGVLIHGMGNLGKSSLAARIASRMTGHTTVVVFGVYDALAIFDRIVDAVPAQQRAGIRATWRDAVIADAAVLGDALEELLEGPLDQEPVLLIIDDLERILEKPEQSDAPTPVRQRCCATMEAVLRAFRRARTDSHLLLTSRYLFALPDGRGGDLAEGLTRVPLRPMEEGDRIKQLRAAARTAKREDVAVDSTLALRALEAAAGNPGLQAALTTPVLKGETAAAEQALGTIEHFRNSGAPPEEIRRLIGAGIVKDEPNAMMAFFQRMAFDTYRAALTPPQATMLRAACVFSMGLPIPCPALQAAGAAAGVSDPGAAFHRLLGLGLADDWGVMNETPHAAVNPLARPLAGPLDRETTSRLAYAALPPLSRVWRDAKGDIPWDPRAVEVTRLALLAPNPDPALLDNAAEAAARYLFSRQHDARRAHDEVLQPALARLNAMGAAPGHSLLRIACDCAERLGEREVQDRVVDMMMESDARGFDRGSALLRHANANARLGALTEAEHAYTEAAAAFRDAGVERDWAIARSGVADILEARGELDEALRIRTQEELPVYERLGDVREKAVTQGKIADILQARGELDEALALHEQRLPIAEHLGDIDSIAHIKFSTAYLRLQRGDHNTEGIQQIYEDLSEAFEISLKLGRPDFIGVIGQLLAQVLAMGGRKADALKVLQHATEAFEKLGNAQRLAQVRQLSEMISKLD